MKPSRLSSTALSLALLSLSSTVFADVAPEPEYEACYDKMEGEACSYTSFDGVEVTGQCVSGVCTEVEEPVAGTEHTGGTEHTHTGGAEHAHTGGADHEHTTAEPTTTEAEDDGCHQSPSHSAPLWLLAAGALAFVIRRKARS